MNLLLLFSYSFFIHYFFSIPYVRKIRFVGDLTMKGLLFFPHLATFCMIFFVALGVGEPAFRYQNFYNIFQKPTLSKLFFTSLSLTLNANMKHETVNNM